MTHACGLFLLRQIEMLATGLKYRFGNEEKGRRVRLAKGQNSTPPKQEGGRIVRLQFDSPCDMMHTLIPYTQQVTEVIFKYGLSSSMKSFLNDISTHTPMLET